MTVTARLLDFYKRLHDYFGPQQWWPADSVFEVVVGAVLTQNTSWRNVTIAIERLRQHGVLGFDELSVVPEQTMAELIRPSGYYNLKARRLLNLLNMIGEYYDGHLERLFAEETTVARKRLLEVKGIGAETADSILLYAGNHPVFVVDAYTYRICYRHGLIGEECDYRNLQDLFMDNLPTDTALYNEYHALLVAAGKRFCKKNNPNCDGCPLQDE